MGRVPLAVVGGAVIAVLEDEFADQCLRSIGAKAGAIGYGYEELGQCFRAFVGEVGLGWFLTRIRSYLVSNT